MSSISPVPIKICLNMIVKNESRIIERALASVVDIIDTYCIEDTGSTDNTIELITRFFDEKGIPGKIVEEPFRDFAHNRTHALQQAAGMADYLLFIDSDMVFTHSITPAEIRTRLSQYDVFYVYQGSTSFYYKNVRFAKNRPEESRYITPTHEYFDSPVGSRYDTFKRDEVFIDDRGDGGSKENKYHRDIELLTAELERIGGVKAPGADRCLFYLANSYRDAGLPEKAIEYYRLRTEAGGWAEEQWYSLYSIGNLYKDAGEVEKAIFYWMSAYEKHPKRVENLYKIVEYYRQSEKYHTALFFWKLADRCRTEHVNWGDYLFLQNDIYTYLLDYEYSILGYYVPGCDQRELVRSAMTVLARCSSTYFETTLKNYKFYAPVLGESDSSILGDNLNLLRSIGKETIERTTSTETDSDVFYQSTPSLVLIDDRTLVVSVRCVNYYINDNGEYINRDKVVSKNAIATIDMSIPEKWRIKTDEKELVYNRTMDCYYVGLEDIRLLCYNGEIIYNANRGLAADVIAVEHGKIDIENVAVTRSSILKKFTHPFNQIEKNWVIFVDPRRDRIQCVYSWGDPMIIGEIDDNGIFSQRIKIDDTPVLFGRLRGSSNGVAIPDTNEIWFLCHVVSFEEGRRRYYHLFVVLDVNTYRPIKYSMLFTFRKEYVEYSTGVVFLAGSDEFLIGFSTMDRRIDYLTVAKSAVEMIPI